MTNELGISAGTKMVNIFLGSISLVVQLLRNNFEVCDVYQSLFTTENEESSREVLQSYSI